MGILDEVQSEVQNMNPDQLKEAFAKLQKDREARQAKQKEYNAKPEVQEKRKEYAKQYREKDPEKFAANRKAYMSRPEVKERQKAYRQKKYAAEKAILARAKELGIALDGTQA